MSAETVGLPLTERSLWLVNESGTWEGSGAVPSLQTCVGLHAGGHRQDEWDCDGVRRSSAGCGSP